VATTRTPLGATMAEYTPILPMHTFGVTHMSRLPISHFLCFFLSFGTRANTHVLERGDAMTSKENASLLLSTLFEPAGFDEGILVDGLLPDWNGSRQELAAKVVDLIIEATVEEMNKRHRLPIHC